MKTTHYKLFLLSLLLTPPAFAADFNLPFVNAAGLGTAYSDWATAVSDASSAYTNPAGLAYLHNQQLVGVAMGINGSTKFTGTSQTPPYPFPLTVAQSGAASSRIGAFMPSFYYAYPVNNRLTVAISQNAPFALGSNYSTDSIVRYVSTRSSVVGIDLGPSFGYQISDKFSFGLGLDAVRLAFTLNSMFGPPVSIPDAESQNHLAGWGYGYHGGLMYQPSPATRLGASFNSMVSIHTTGDSEAWAPFGVFRTTNQKTNARLPARAQFSIQHDANQFVTLMATAFYTNWRTFKQITMKRVMLPGGTTTSVTIPFNFHNTFDYSFGAHLKPCEKWILKMGIQFLSAPSNNQSRAVADPIGSAVILGLGAHYQQSKKLGYDVGLGHSFFKEEQVNLTTPLSALSGHNSAQTSVLGAQISWNMT